MAAGLSDLRGFLQPSRFCDSTHTRPAACPFQSLVLMQLLLKAHSPLPAGMLEALQQKQQAMCLQCTLDHHAPRTLPSPCHAPQHDASWSHAGDARNLLQGGRAAAQPQRCQPPSLLQALVQI
uniref:Uncharacterized protein n=1 Tax=Phasianus colchicus TaxID=9054 RepID=A0A669PHQ6_PHACC